MNLCMLKANGRYVDQCEGEMKHAVPMDPCVSASVCVRARVCVCVFKLRSHKASHQPCAPRGRQLITPTKHIHTLYPSCHSAYSLPPAPAS